MADAPPDVGAYDEDEAKLKAFFENFQEDDVDGETLARNRVDVASG